MDRSGYPASDQQPRSPGAGGCCDGGSAPPWGSAHPGHREPSCGGQSGSEGRPALRQPRVLPTAGSRGCSCPGALRAAGERGFGVNPARSGVCPALGPPASSPALPSGALILPSPPPPAASDRGRRGWSSGAEAVWLWRGGAPGGPPAPGGRPRPPASTPRLRPLPADSLARGCGGPGRCPLPRITSSLPFVHCHTSHGDTDGLVTLLHLQPPSPLPRNQPPGPPLCSAPGTPSRCQPAPWLPLRPPPGPCDSGAAAPALPRPAAPSSRKPQHSRGLQFAGIRGSQAGAELSHTRGSRLQPARPALPTQRPRSECWADGHRTEPGGGTQAGLPNPGARPRPAPPPSASCP